MKIIHPAFDGMWYVEIDGQTIEAPTIRALKKFLGKGFKIKDYIPLNKPPLVVEYAKEKFMHEVGRKGVPVRGSNWLRKS